MKHGLSNFSVAEVLLNLAIGVMKKGVFRLRMIVFLLSIHPTLAISQWFPMVAVS